jgi:hypothetical protein
VPNPAFRFNSSFFKLFFYAIARASFGRFAISRKNSLQKLWGFYCNLGQKEISMTISNSITNSITI